MGLIHKCLLHQHFTLGNEIVEVTNGIIEGQSTSNRIQNTCHQMLLNKFIEEIAFSNHELARRISAAIKFFVDDLINLQDNRQVDMNKVYCSGFNWETKISHQIVQFLGLSV